MARYRDMGAKRPNDGRNAPIPFYYALFFLDFLDQIGVHELLAVALHIHLIGTVEVLDVAPEDYGGLLGIEFHHVTDAPGLLAGHHRAA